MSYAKFYAMFYAVSYAMSCALSAVFNDCGQRAGFGQPDDGSAGWTSGRPPLTMRHRAGPARREGSA